MTPLFLNLKETNSSAFILLLALTCLIFKYSSIAQEGPVLHFSFDQNLKSTNYQFSGPNHSFINGLNQQALQIKPSQEYPHLSLDKVSLDGSKNFTIQCWIKTNSNKPMVILSQKDFTNKGISTQKNAGWVLYNSGGTFAWSIGSGDRRINYERDNGEIMPINDGKWHQLTITFDKDLSEFRLYFDGHNKAIYNVGFDFSNDEFLVIGSQKGIIDHETQILPEIESGAQKLQALVDAFNGLGLVPLKDDEFIDLIVDPSHLFDKKTEKLQSSEIPSKEGLSKALDIRKEMLTSPYTVYQNKALTLLKPISKIYALKNNKVIINQEVARFFTMKEKLYPADFAMDELSIWERALSAEEILAGFSKYQKGKAFKYRKNLKNFIVGVWNIWHGGIHWTAEKDGWDSRLRIAEMIKKNKIDVVLMQETYSSGDFIAAELGYYFATTSDWDYRYQGANISVLSRYPVKEIKVLEATEFNNVAVKLAISKTQEIWAISNWYGMAQFPAVFDFHKKRFANANNIPVLFGGDFNAVPHTDGGDSPASEKLQADGFIEAFRSKYPDVEKYPGFTHRSGSRIDQLYFKGKGLENTFTEVLSTWPTGFPSDHYLIVSRFKLGY